VWLSIAVGAVLAAGIALQAALGFGASMLASPILLALLEPVQVVSLLLVCGLLVGPLILAEGGQRMRVQWKEAGGLLAAAAVGLPLGVVVLGALGKQPMQLLVGVLVLLSLVAQRVRPARRTGPVSGAVAGMASGVLTTSTGLNGPPLILWLRGRGHSPEVFRATITVVFLATSVFGLVSLIIGADPKLSAGLLAAAVLGTLAGWAVGARVFWRMEARHHRRAVTVLLVAAAIASLVAGLAG
jgi:uncharacterized membrane protein YfcA